MREEAEQNIGRGGLCLGGGPAYPSAWAGLEGWWFSQEALAITSRLRENDRQVVRFRPEESRWDQLFPDEMFPDLCADRGRHSIAPRLARSMQCTSGTHAGRSRRTLLPDPLGMRHENAAGEPRLPRKRPLAPGSAPCPTPALCPYGSATARSWTRLAWLSAGPPPRRRHTGGVDQCRAGGLEPRRR